MPKALAPSNLLAAFKLTQLKSLAFQTGLPLTGTKSALQSQLTHALRTPQLAGAGPYRILSVDMGIRNLAYCVLEVSEQAIKQHVSRQAHAFDAPDTLLQMLARQQGTSTDLVRVLAWKRIALSNAPSASRMARASASQDSSTVSAAGPVPDRAESFEPPALAALAYTLVQEHFLPQKPTHILIERQRHRSGGSSAVLEWTFRVNMLESIIYAVLHTLQRVGRGNSSAAPLPTPLPVDPKRVASYWTNAAHLERSIRASRLDSGSQKKLKGKGEKAERIAIAREWLERGLSCANNAQEAKSLLLRRPARQKSLDGVSSSTKVDDLADCLLQGVAFLQWELHRRMLAGKGLLLM